MSALKILQAVEDPAQTRKKISSYSFAVCLTILGLLIRLANAWYRFLNADEALHYLLSVQSSFAASYRASLTTVHPPLLILWLHLWRTLGHSEFLLRLPMVIAGTLFCWVMFLWLERVTSKATALIGLALFLFSPPLIQLSSEIRQYAFLLLFCSLSLYFLELSFESGSILKLLCSGLALYLALCTHYSSLLFALALGLYALVRFPKAHVRPRFILTWAALQLGGLAVAVFFYISHIAKIRASGAEESLLDSYLNQSVPHPGQSWFWFAGRSNLRLFHYLFSQAVVGVLGLLLFITGIVLLSRNRAIANALRPTGKQLAFLLAFPLIANCGFAFFHLYPYGGTRHNSYLAIFIFPAIAVSIGAWKPSHNWWKAAVLFVVLAFCNLFPVPMDQYIRLRDQSRIEMANAVADLRASPANSIILTDDQGGLLLSYYLCGNKVVQIEQHPFQPFMRAACGEFSVISIDPDWWIFKADTFPEMFHGVQQTYNLQPGTPLLFFQAGWFINKEYALREELRQYGCTVPRNFGHSMFICPLIAGSS